MLEALSSPRLRTKAVSKVGFVLSFTRRPFRSLGSALASREGDLAAHPPKPPSREGSGAALSPNLPSQEGNGWACRQIWLRTKARSFRDFERAFTGRLSASPRVTEPFGIQLGVIVKR